VCTTGAFIPQILKIRRQGGGDLSYPMLFVYLTGIVLWLAYGLMLHAAAIIWANAATALLVAIAIVLKMTHPSQ
jgi:MtN3 and saliva related transmembrane protein